MSATLCLDYGNTRRKAALFTDGRLQQTWVLETDDAAHLQSIINEHKPQRSILSSVVHHDAAIDALLSAHTQFHRLSSASQLNFTLPVGKPETMGADRLAAAAAAVFYYPQQHNLVITMGTCITYNFINSDHQFMGGGISAGLSMRMLAMHQQTAVLPLVKSDWNVPLIGYDTATNMQSGTVLGAAFEIDGFISAYAERYGNFNALLTGGDMGTIAPHLKNKIFADPELLFKGLYAISQINTA
jgi:type III pantothenate kinase